MQYSIEIIAILTVLALVVVAINRRKHADAHGNAMLRYHGPALFCFSIGAFFLYQAAKPAIGSLSRNGLAAFATAPPAVDLALAALGLIASLWFFKQKIKLTDDEILHSPWPLRTRWYAREEIVAVERKLGIVIRFKDGKRLELLPCASGVPNFLIQLELIAARAHGEPEPCIKVRRHGEKSSLCS